MIKKVIILLTLSLTFQAYAQKNKSIVVLELFTSQGCSSCPPADVLLKDIKSKYNHQQVYVLSYHVDYWNRLGWKDPFSKPEFSDYQRRYATKFNSNSIYTPQLVVNGRIHFTGSNEYKAYSAIKKYLNEESLSTVIIRNIERTEDRIEVTYNFEAKEAKSITFVLLVDEKKTNVSRGENRNKTIINSNVVADKVDRDKNEGTIFLTIPDWVNTTDKLSVIAYVKDDDQNVIGGTKHDF